MGIFGQSSAFDADVEKATSETNTNENWSFILDVCDKVSSNPRNAKDCLKAILKRMGHNDPHVVMQAITLLDACVNNCGKPFHLEIASREFENEFRRLLSKAQPQVAVKMRQVLKGWAENYFRNDPELNLIYSLYTKLRHEGQDFSNLNDKPDKSKAKTALPKDPNVVTSQQEEDDIAKAIELSLNETKSSPSHQVSSSSNNSTAVGGGSSYPSLYPSFSTTAASGSLSGSANTSPANAAAASSTNNQQQAVEARKVRALYDFEAAEENELTFFAGDIIHVLDDSDPNWWKGYNQRGEGLFPSNFVTADLSVDPKRLDINQKQNKNGQFDDDGNELQLKTESAEMNGVNQRIEIDEAKIDRLLHLLHEANPKDPSTDTEEMLRLEQEVHQMGPLIDAELERVDRKHAQLTQLSSDLVDAINLYHSLMRDDRTSMLSGGASGVGGNSYLPGMIPGMHMAPTSMGYQGAMPNPQMMYGPAGYPGAGAAGGGFPPTSAYGMTSLPYAGNSTLPGMPSTNIPTANATQIAGGMATGNLNVPYAPQQIPLQFQNGHANSTQVNGIPVMQGQSQLNNTMPHAGLQQQHQQQQQQQQIPQTNASSFPVLSQQQQPQPQQQFPQSSTVIGNDLQQQQYMSPQHQNQQPQHMPYMAHQQASAFASIPNGQHPQLNGMHQIPTHAMGQQAAPAPISNPTNMDQFSQMQQQMAAMSLGVAGAGMAGINQPITQNFLNQNETKQNIPIYQQQR